jgi:hypothetical protein
MMPAGVDVAALRNSPIWMTLVFPGTGVVGSESPNGLHRLVGPVSEVRSWADANRAGDWRAS